MSGSRPVNVCQGLVAPCFPPPFPYSFSILLHTHLLPHNYTHIMSKSFSTSDVASHNKADNLWIIVDQDVYDLTKFQEEHPGGKKSK